MRFINRTKLNLIICFCFVNAALSLIKLPTSTPQSLMAVIHMYSRALNKTTSNAKSTDIPNSIRVACLVYYYRVSFRFPFRLNYLPVTAYAQHAAYVPAECCSLCNTLCRSTSTNSKSDIYIFICRHILQWLAFFRTQIYAGVWTKKQDERSMELSQSQSAKYLRKTNEK